ncbi:nucleotidyl transferase AbiEii/AbiGii toxin family protein [Thermodesulfatator atlanticus]|uniref:nucleotidyl transferase AbiEii/AbiGii toxin family protein n=1 Tax=Thermodesulfatator atlanticus TaxID=501497 RepID=UPI0003B7B58F|nr:nucleotidyl transferase AbiEii/AbiGii toxin family protein [Thermodesulfatator atlanticus]
MKKLLKQQKKVLEKLFQSGLTEGFYLTGGTALALKYGHRFSEDLDFFSFPESSGKNFPLQRFSSFTFKNKNFEIIELEKETVHLRIENILVSFFSYPYPLLEKPDKLDLSSGEILIASDKDIVASKAIAIAQRGSKKDFFDLYFLMRKYNWNLRDILNLCRQKFNLKQENIAFLLKGFSYFYDAEKGEVYFLDERKLAPEEWQQIKDFFSDEVLKYLKENSIPS